MSRSMIGEGWQRKSRSLLNGRLLAHLLEQMTAEDRAAALGVGAEWKTVVRSYT